MKKILIISDGIVGQHFVQRVIDTYTQDNLYYFIETKAGEYNNVNPARHKFFAFDPTSLYKLSNVLKMDFIQAIVMMESWSDLEHTVKNIRSFKEKLRIVVLDKWDKEFDDPNLLTIDSNELLASRLIDYLPNVPVIAQNVGIGEGEIMEVLVPFGSSFVYRHVGVIEQKNWRIVAIYRNRELIMPTRRRMIQPNDLLVLVGEPTVLKSVYRSIKRELGQFPEPFGTNLYLFIDMLKDSNEKNLKLIQRAQYAHIEFKHSLIIKIYNPSDLQTLEKIFSYRSDNVIIDVCYDREGCDLEPMILSDIKKYHVGLVMVSRKLFSYSRMRELLFECNVPVLKIANRSFSKLKDVLVVVNGNRDLEKVSTTVFDISAQLGFNLELFNNLSEEQEVKKEIIENYTNLSTIFSKNIKLTEVEENTIRYLRKRDNFLQCLPFSEKILISPFMSLFSTDSEKLYAHLDDYHQIFIPVQI